MTTSRLVYGLASLLAASTLFACSADAGDPATGSTASALDTPPVPPEPGPLPDPPTPVPPQPGFACGTVSCDASTQYCLHTVGGVRPGPGHPNGSFACKSIPPTCTAAPSCACIAPFGPRPFLCSGDASTGMTVTLLAP